MYTVLGIYQPDKKEFNHVVGFIIYSDRSRDMTLFDFIE